MIEREVIVVGGGPAGASAAWALNRRGMDCLVLDRETFPREKLCAGWITPEVVRDLEFDPADYPGRFLTFDELRIHVKGLGFPLRTPQHSIRRFEFDRWLLERSAAPVAQHNVRHVEPDGEGYRIDDKYRCRYLVGAGGTRCPVYRDLFRAAQPRPKALQAVTLELEFPFAWRDGACHLWFLAGGLPGYAWYVPKADGYLNIGVGGMADKLKRRDDEIRRHWDGLVQRLLAGGLLDAPPAQPGGYSYFLRGGTERPRLGNAFVVGDAAGLATRDMCEGIGPAVQSGLRAARAILDGQPFDFDGIGAYTSANRWVRRGLEYLYLG
ncbi:MAG: FAD-dependent monooxygenase [Pseudomonadales bacterium]|nr:FAD-dependent monooxygenase [Pseudomonadales bacterium]